VRQFTCEKAVTHLTTNRAQCRATALIETNALTYIKLPHLKEYQNSKLLWILVHQKGSTRSGGNDTWNSKPCKGPVKSPSSTSTQLFTGQMPLLPPNQRCQSSSI